MPTDKAKLTEAIAGLAVEFKSLVAEIEADPVPTTQNNYGRYMNILGLVGQGDKAWTKCIALALIEAGANRAGVMSALKIYGG